MITGDVPGDVRVPAMFLKQAAPGQESLAAYHSLLLKKERCNEQLPSKVCKTSYRIKAFACHVPAHTG